MEKREFHSTAELEEVSNHLARGSKHPVYVDRGTRAEDVNYNRKGKSGWEIEGEVPPATPSTQIEPELVSVVNDRNDEVVYTGSPGYALVQHRDVLDIARSVVSETAGDLDMGVIRDYGSQFDGTMVFSNKEKAKINVEDVVDTDGYIPPEDEVDRFGGGRARDTVGLGMRIGNSFNGESKVYASTMGYRFICQNWLVWGEETISHGDRVHFSEEDDEEFIAETLYEMFENVISEVFDIREDTAARIRQAESEEIPFEWVPGVLEDAGFGSTYSKRITGRVLRQTSPKPGHTTAWRVYNAATAELDHNRVDSIKLSSYNDNQARASTLIEEEPRKPGEEMSPEELDEFAIRP